MATVTRSRRVDPPIASVPQRRQPQALQAQHQHPSQHQYATTGLSPPRRKRSLELCDHDLDAIKKKKARITVEILSKQQHSPSRTLNPKQPLNPAAFDANRQVAAPVAHQHHHTRTRHSPPPPPQQPQRPQQADNSIAVKTNHIPKYREKVVNGIKHELELLQPAMSDTKDAVGGRKLRSQEASRFKSELSAYFPDYDEVIGNDPKEQHILNIETPIVLVDPKPTTYIPPPIPGAATTSIAISAPIASTSTKHIARHNPNHGVRHYSSALFTDLHDAVVNDFSTLEKSYKGKTTVDPLADDAYLPAHRKAERLEKSIRNTERGRAQHEKDQIIRLLEGLQGPDWLRIMGVSGITETKKKDFEPARAHFIKGCKAILEKFRLWSLEEKRRKLEKDAAAKADRAREEGEESEEDEDAEEDEEEEVDDSDEEGDEDEEMLDSDDEANASNARSDTIDVDASIAKQLRDEAMARSKVAAAKAKRAAKRAHSPDAGPSLRGGAAKPAPPPKPEKPFTSFFAKKHERDAALSRSRRKGRTVLAFGHELPKLRDAEFELPSEYRDEELVKTRERAKRRDRRESKH